MFEQKQRSRSRNLTSNEYVGILKDLTRLQTKVYSVIEALDDPPDPRAFVDALKQLSDRDYGTPINLLISSRNSVNLESLLMPIVTNHIFISNEDNSDIQLFIATEVNQRFRSGKLKLPDPELVDLTISKIVARADGLFLQAKLLLDFVFAGRTSRSIRNSLTGLPNGLEETYETILRRTTMENRRHVGEIKRSLQWLSLSFVPLIPAMLVEAAAIDSNDVFLDPEAFLDEADLIGMLSSLVLVDWSHAPPVVSLAHQTVLEYLQSQSILQSDMAQFHIDVCTTHQYLAETSIQYLLFPESENYLREAARLRAPPTLLQSHYHDPFEAVFTLASTIPYFASEPAGYHDAKNLSLLQLDNEMHCRPLSVPNAGPQYGTNIGPCLTHNAQNQALLNYVANLWPEHLKRGKCATDDFSKRMAPKLQWYLYPRQNGGLLYESWEAFQRRRLSSSLYFYEPFRTSNQQVSFFRQLLKSAYFNYIGHETTQNPFFYTILFGLDDCFDSLRDSYDVNTAFLGGWTPLTVAAASGSFTIAKKLLEAGADVNKPADFDERNGLTPLHVAAKLAMEDLVALFLAHGASISSLTVTMTTPFYRAARGGSIKALKLLHDAGSDVNAPSWDYYTPLMEAVNWSNRDGLDLLLSWGADPEYRNRLGESPIDKAINIGDEGVVEELREARSKYSPKPVDSPTIRCRAAMTKWLRNL